MRPVDRRRADRIRRHQRVRKKVLGTAERPRLSVFRSHQHIYAQIIDDLKGHTLVAASTVEADFSKADQYYGNMDAAQQIGARIAKKALEKGIDTVVFDRGGNRYHGRIAALADAAREQGLNF